MTINLTDNGFQLPPRHGRGDWMQTWMGGAFYILDPRASEVHIQDIAHALSMLCRYNGHTSKFYSVAEHSVTLSYAVAPGNALAALFHDASEAYLGDMIRPLKRYDDFYKEVERNLMRVIMNKFHITHIPQQVKDYDTRILVDERDALMATPPQPWFANENVRPLGVKIVGYEPRRARTMFLNRYRELEKARVKADAEG